MRYKKSKKIEVVNWIDKNWKIDDSNNGIKISTSTYKEAIDYFNLDVKPKTIGRWYKSITGKNKKELKKESQIEISDITKTSIKDLMLKEDETLERFQKVVDGEVPYQEMFRMIEGLNGNLTIKIDGTVKGLVETTMLIGNKRRELRGVLPLKEERGLRIKEEELRLKSELKDIELRKQELIIKEKELDIKIKEIENKRLFKGKR